jgi:putative CocE/NonD family hydrolase
VWATTEKYRELRRRLSSPVKLLLGPWLHGYDEYARSFAGEVDFGHDSILDGLDDRRLAFFDRWLRGFPTAVDDAPAVRIFVMGGGDGRRNADGRLRHGGRWRDESDWPPPAMQPTRYFLRAGGLLSGGAPEDGSPPDEFRFDPNDPVPTVGSSTQSSLLPGLLLAGGYDQRGRSDLLLCRDERPLAAREDVLVYQTPPLERDVELTGPISVVLFVASSAPDTDFTVKLVDVYPPTPEDPEGFALNLTDGILRMRYRDGFERGRPMKPGEVYRVLIEPQATSNLFPAGHRIRLDVSSSSFPHFDVNPNTGEPLGRHRGFAVAQNSVFHDALWPSHVVLPVVPRS